MRKSTKLLKRFAALFLLVLMSIESFAATVSDNDGAAFITKAEFDSLKNEFLRQLTAYNTSIDNKIESIISQYLSGIKTKQTKDLESLLNKLSDGRRTFVDPITNIADYTQNNLYIETNGFWVAILPMSERSWSTWCGYMLAGINNYEGGHNKRPWSKNSRDHNNQDGHSYPVGSFFLIDPLTDKASEEYFYITDKNLKNLKFYVYSCGATVYTANLSPVNLTTAPNWSYPTSLTWTATYNWTGLNNRKVGTGGGADWNVEACETIALQLPDADEISWYDKMSGSTVYATEAGCLTSKNQYNWTKQYSNYYLWHDPAAQCLGAIWSNNTTCNSMSNNYNDSPYDPPVKLNFKAPEISRIKGDKFVVKDVCDLTGEYVKYYSGLPLAMFPKKGKLTLKLSPTLGGGATSFRIGIAYNQFGNNEVVSEPASNLIYTNVFNNTDIDSRGQITIELPETSFSNFTDKTLWIKATPNGGTTSRSVTIKTDSILLEYEG